MDVSDTFVPFFIDQLREEKFSPSYFCEVQFQACNNRNNAYKVLGKKDYQTNVLRDKPDIIKDNNYINNLYEQIQEDLDAGNKRETLLMYHFSDLHWNLDYTEGSSNN